MFRATALLVLFGCSTAFVSAKSYHKDSKFPEGEYKEWRQDNNLDDAEDISYWTKVGRDEIGLSLTAASERNSGIAKNVILFVGDGMSIPTLAASRIYKAQQLKGDFITPEKEYLTFERFPNLGHSKTYDIDYQIADSASTASAMFSGVKTKYYSLGYDSHIDNYNSSSGLTANEVETIMTWAQNAEKYTGIVTTARATHATPGAMYAHVYDRDWECDSMFNISAKAASAPPEGLHDIAWQLVNRTPGNKARVVLGGGAPAFYPRERMEEVKGWYNPLGEPWDECFRSDNLELADQWLEDHGPNAKLVHNRDDLLAVNAQETEYLLGLLAEDHVEYDDLRTDKDPSLSEMVQKAIEILSKGPSGFFLLVEGGRIDHAHHDARANRALSETVALDLAVEKAVQMMREAGREDETLFIVTADHAHTMSINGYAKRGTDIRGLSGKKFDDGLPYTTLSYANGLGYYDHNIVDPDNPQNVTRKNLTDMAESVKALGFTQTSAAFKESETHGGDDVAIFAKGPMSHLFHTTHEQTFIAYVMAYSACVGPYSGDQQCVARNSAPSTNVVVAVTMLLALLTFKVI